MPENNSSIVEDAFVNPAGILLEEGKCYLNRKGDHRGPLVRKSNPMFTFEDPVSGDTFQINGSWCTDRGNMHDLDLVTPLEIQNGSTTFNDIQVEIHATSVMSGWWVNPIDATLACFANIHGEISEAWEAWRIGNPPSEKIQGFSKMEEELADAVIRIMDVCEANGWFLESAIQAKNEYNKGREYRHGNKKY